MKRTVLSGLFAALLATSAQAADKPNLVTVLTADDAQAQLMSMVLSMQAMQQGSKIHILLCGAAGDLALKNAPASATAPQKPKGMSPQGLMQKIMSSGGTVEVCAIYLPNKGVGQDALLDGIAPAKPDEMAGRLLADNTRLLSF
jgi:predicted peroxiredoxin